MISGDDIEALKPESMEDTIYLHSTKEEMEDKFEDTCVRAQVAPTDKALDTSRYAAYEVTMDGYWTIEGKFMLTKVNGVELKEAVAI